MIYTAWGVDFPNFYDRLATSGKNVHKVSKGLDHEKDYSRDRESRK